MEATTDTGVSGQQTPVTTISPEIGPGEEAAVQEAQKFDLGKAIRYAVPNFGASTVWTLFNTGMPLYLDTYHLNPALIGLLANERSFVGAFVQPVVGRISDRTRTPIGRRRPFFLIGIPLMSLSILLLSIHPPFWTMMGIMTIASFFLAMAVDPYMALMADIFPSDQRGKVGGLQGMTNALGAITFSLLALVLWGQHEPLVFALVIVCLLGTWGYAFFTVKEPPLGPYIKPQNEVREPFFAKAGRYTRELLTYSEATKYTIAMTLFWIGNGGAAPYVTLFGKHALGVKDEQTFLLPIMYIVVTAVFAVPAGYLADRIGKKRVMTVGLLIYGLGAVIGSQSPTLPIAVAALAVIGLGNACVGILVALLTDLIPKSRTAEMVGMFSAVTSFAQPLGSALAGGVIDLAARWVGIDQGYRWAFIVAGVSILLAVAVLQTVHPDRAARQIAAAEAQGA